MTEDEMVGWHHRHNGHGFERALGVGGQRSLAYCSPWDHKELDTTEQLKLTKFDYSDLSLIHGLKKVKNHLYPY